MTNITLSIDDALLAESRKHAASKGVSLNGMIREMLAEAVATPTQTIWFNEFKLVSEQAMGDSKGWRFDREEVYSERL